MGSRMNNPELIKFITNNRTKLLHHGYKFFKNEQAAEDCLQKLYLKFLAKDYGIVNNISSFVYTALYSHFHNFKRTNKKYKMDFINNDQQSQGFDEELLEKYLQEKPEIPQYEEMIDNYRLLDMLYRNIALLPKNQRKEIENRLNGETTLNNTKKANYRHGMLKLKKNVSRTGH